MIAYSAQMAQRLLRAFRGTPDGYRKVAADYGGREGWVMTALDDGLRPDDGLGDEWHVIMIDDTEFRFVPGPPPSRA